MAPRVVNMRNLHNLPHGDFCGWKAFAGLRNSPIGDFCDREAGQLHQVKGESIVQSQFASDASVARPVATEVKRGTSYCRING